MLNEGEVLCDKCNGHNDWWCPKCQGKGKLDWVSNAMGSIKPKYCKVSFSQTSMSSEYGFKQEHVNEAAREIATEIDKEILASLSNPVSLKKYFQNYT